MLVAREIARSYPTEQNVTGPIENQTFDERAPGVQWGPLTLRPQVFRVAAQVTELLEVHNTPLPPRSPLVIGFDSTHQAASEGWLQNLAV